MKAYDVIVLGLGVAGAATAAELARRGMHVLGIDQFSPPHTSGSSHGGSRIIREAYYEGAEYVPFVRRAYELWQELERDRNETLLIPCGGLTIGRPDGALVTGALGSARTHGIPHDVLTAADVAERFAAFRTDSDMVAVFEHRAGVLLPEACVASLLDRARRRGAELRFGQRALQWTAAGKSVMVQTDGGTERAASLVIAAGAWLPELLGDVDPGLWIERQVMHWFASAPGSARAPLAPITLWEQDSGRMFYTTPDLGDGGKIAFHHSGQRTTIAEVRRDVGRDETLEIEHVVARHVPGWTPSVLRSATCVYTNTPDYDFLIDRHPAHANVVIASACSGHGFKFGSAVGELAAQLVSGEIAAPPELFALDRFNESGDLA